MPKDKMNLLHPWNRRGNEMFPGTFEISDETLRDGIQAPGIRQPSLQSKTKIIDYIEALGIEAADIGFPAAGPAMRKDIRHIVQHIRDKGYALKPACAARTVESDIAPIADLSQELGVPIEAYVFIGTSPIRQVVEHWSIDHIVGLIKKSVSFGCKHNLPVCFVTEDTTRSKPEHLRAFYETAIEYGASRVCLCDTVGYATPDGTADLVHYVRSFLELHDKNILIDWHGHNDRGLGLSNVFAALQAGVNRVHVTGLGIGERTGNVSLEQLMMNLKLMGLKNFDPIHLKEYCALVSRACEVPVPGNLPIVGGKAFATSTGVHAAAIIKAQKLNDRWLADNIYSSVPAGELGLEQKIEIGPLCGKSNVTYFLSKQGIEDDALAEAIYRRTKEKGLNLSAGEMTDTFKKHGYVECDIINH